MPLQDFRKLSWSIFNGPLLLFQPEATFFILCLEKLNQPGGETPLLFCWGWGRRSDFAGSDVRWVHYLFSIIETPTTNQGKRGSMSYIVLFHWQPLKAIIYFSVWSTWIWLFFIPFSNYQSHREDIAFLNSWLWFSNSSFSHGILINEHKYEHKYQQIKLHSVFKMFLCLFW